MQNIFYTYPEVLEACKKYFNNDELAASVFASKYSLQDNEGRYLELTPTDMFWREAEELARIENKYPNPLNKEKIFDCLNNFKYIVPQGSPMSGIGNPYQIMSLSNCFVINSPADSYAGIMHTDQEEAHLMRRRGGVGFDISNIRPKGLPTNNAAKTTDGISVFMERFSNTCREVAQLGRRGALLLSISCHHPEIKTFINIKRDLKKVTGANISIRVTDEFMNAVKNKEKVQLRWPVDSEKPTISVYEDAQNLWKEMIEANWHSAEPGLLFWDTALKYTPAQIYKDYGYNHTSTNPCGEIILSPHDSCRLLVLNLYNFVDNPFAKNSKFNFEKFGEYAQVAQRLMDDIVDLELECIDRILDKINKDPESEEVKLIEKNLWLKIKEACFNGRRTGLGITALGDCLAALNIKYGSSESIKMTDDIYRTLAINSYRASCILAKERGAFPIFSQELERDHPFLKRIWDAAPDVYELYKKYGRRNIANTTTAPTGSVSTLTQTTSGIEPAYMLSYVRRKKVNPDNKNVKVAFVDALGDSWEEYTVYHHGLQKWMEITGETDVKKSPYWGATANDCDWRAGIDIQGAAQHWVCHAISRTTNLPADISPNLISDIYMKGWENKCKGLTIYRNGSRSGVLIEKESEPVISSDGRPNKIDTVMAPKRPKNLPCDIYHVTVKGVKWTAFIGLLDDKPYELFMGRSEELIVPTKHKHGIIAKISSGNYNLILPGEDEATIKNIIKTSHNDESAWASRLVSTALRHGVPIEYLAEQLSKDGTIVDINNVLARILKKYVKNAESKKTDQCPSCGKSELIYEEKCKRCLSCAWSGCG